MAIIEEPKRIHWNYFIAIDSDIENLSRYIEFTEANFATYSIELVRLLLSAASEIDVVAKLLCEKLSPNTKVVDINDYRKVLTNSLPKISGLKVLMPIYGLELTPWSNWKDNKNPNWWQSYNNVKHQRSLHFSEANLKNVLNAVSGLYILLLYLYKDDAVKLELKPVQKLFKLTGVQIKDWAVGADSIYYDIYE